MSYCDQRILAIIPFFAAAALVAGCNSDSSSITAPTQPAAEAPPPPSRPLETGSADTPAPGGIKELALILPTEASRTVAMWEVTIRTEAARRLTSHLGIFERPAPADPPSRQAELIRSALARSPSALIVIPERDDAVIGPALAEALERGVAVVTMERPVKVPGTKQPTAVVFAPIEPAVGAMVDAAVEEARAAGFSADDPALVMADAVLDERARRRVEALEATLKEKGVRTLPRFGFTMTISQPLSKMVEENPKIAMVFLDGDGAVSSAVNVRHDQRKDRPRFIVAGFADDRKTFEVVDHHQSAGLVDLNQNALARRAVDVAAGLAEGQSYPPQVEVPRPFRKADRSAPERIMARPPARTNPRAVTKDVFKD